MVSLNPTSLQFAHSAQSLTTRKSLMIGALLEMVTAIGEPWREARFSSSPSRAHPVYVRGEAARNGVGTALYTSAEGAEHGVREIDLDASLAAVAFYGRDQVRCGRPQPLCAACRSSRLHRNSSVRDRLPVVGRRSTSLHFISIPASRVTPPPAVCCSCVGRNHAQRPAGSIRPPDTDTATSHETGAVEPWKRRRYSDRDP